MLVTDHCPFTNKEKLLHKELAKIPNGLCGLDFFVPFSFGLINSFDDQSLMKICRLLSSNPAKIAGLDSSKGKIAPGFNADISLIEKIDNQRVKARKNLFNPYKNLNTNICVTDVFLRGNHSVQNKKITSRIGKRIK